MKNFFNYIFLFILVCFLNSCTDVIDVDAPIGKKRLVVEASINWQKGTSGNVQTIKLSTTRPYFGNSESTKITGAKVTIIKNNDKSIFVFADQKDGTYVANDFVPQLNQSYTLKINYNGKKYQATETMVSVADIKVIKESVFSAFGEDEKIIEVYYDDPANIENFYLTEFNHVDFPSLKVRDDKFSDGNENKMRYNDEVLKSGDVVGIKLFGISKRYFNYMQLLIAQAGEGGGRPFESAPVRLYGNCKNINNPKEEVLGYFKLSEFVKTEYQIK